METKINIRTKKEIILIFFSIFLISLVSAVDLGSIPPLPDHFMGEVTINGQSVAVGTQISIYVDSKLKNTVLTTIVGEYNLYVTAGEFNDTIEFKIQDILAGSSTRQDGETIPLDLSITTTPSSPPPSSGGDSGGGGGGSGGGGGGIISPPQVNETEESGSGSEDNTIQISETKEEQEDIAANTAGITGAVIGFVESGKGITTLVIIVILVIGVILIKFRPQKWKRSSS